MWILIKTFSHDYFQRFDAIEIRDDSIIFRLGDKTTTIFFEDEECYEILILSDTQARRMMNAYVKDAFNRWNTMATLITKSGGQSHENASDRS